MNVREGSGGRTRELEHASGVAVGYKNGLPSALIRWILARDPSGEREAWAFLRTDANREPEAIPRLFVFRWRIGTTFQEVREYLGVETQRQRFDLAILRTTPALLRLHSLKTV